VTAKAFPSGEALNAIVMERRGPVNRSARPLPRPHASTRCLYLPRMPGLQLKCSTLEAPTDFPILSMPMRNPNGGKLREKLANLSEENCAWCAVPASRIVGRPITPPSLWRQPQSETLTKNITSTLIATEIKFDIFLPEVQRPWLSFAAGFRNFSNRLAGSFDASLKAVASEKFPSYRCLHITDGRLRSWTTGKSYLEKFAAWGATPSIERYLALFDPHATLQHPGMAEPISGDDIRAFITRDLNSVTDYRLVPTSWAARGDTLFIETRQSARITGREVVWRAALCLELRGDRVLSGRAYCDPTIVAKALVGNAT
jgi:ketosteroid isomerase-like protein